MTKKLLTLFALSLIFAPSLVLAADLYVKAGYICSTSDGKFSKKGSVILYGGISDVTLCTEPNDQSCIDRAFARMNEEIKKRSGSSKCVCLQDKSVKPTLAERVNSPLLVDTVVKEGGSMCGEPATGATVAPTTNPLSFTPQVSIPDSEFVAEQATPLTDNTSLICDYIIAVYKYGIMIIGVFAVVAMAIGGAMWILAMGNSKLVSMGKEWIISGLLGLALALGAFMILASINKDLVTCNIQGIKKIAYRPLPAENAKTTIMSDYVNAGRTCKKPAKSFDSSGKYWCCQAYGDIDMTGWVDDDTKPVYATFESADKAVALQECQDFYDKKRFAGNEKDLNAFISGHFEGAVKITIASIGGSFIPFLGGLLTAGGLYDIGSSQYNLAKDAVGNGKAGLRFEPRQPSATPSPTNPKNQAKNTAEVYPGACWEISGIKEIAVGADCPDFCKIKGDFKSCMTTTGTEGYCFDGACLSCKRHCQLCTKDVQCPIQKADPKASGLTGLVCGKEYFTSGSEFSSDCEGPLVGAEWYCGREFDVNGDGDVDGDDDCDNCVGIPDGTLCVFTDTKTQGTCKSGTCQPITQ